MKFFVFFFCLLSVFDYSFSAATIQTVTNLLEKGKRAYRVLADKNYDEYLNSQFETNELRKIIFNYFSYKDSFNRVNLLEYFLTNEQSLRDLKNKFTECQKNDVRCKNLNDNSGNENLRNDLNLKELTNAGTKVFFQKIIDQEPLKQAGLIDQKSIENNLVSFLDQASKDIKKTLQRILEEDNKNAHDLFTHKNNISPANQTNLQFIEDQIKNDSMFELINYLKNDFYFFQQMGKNVIQFPQENNIIIENKKNLDDFFNKESLKDLKTFFVEKKLADLSGNYFEEILTNFLDYNKTILEKIKNDKNKLIKFYSIYFSFPFDFSLFENEEKFKAYIVCLFSAFLFFAKKDNLPIIEKASLLIEFLDNAQKINIIYCDPGRKNIINKNLKNLIILYFLKTEEIKDINLKSDFFKLFYQNLIKFDFEKDNFYTQDREDNYFINKMNQIISTLKFIKKESGIFIDSINQEFYKKKFSNLFFMSTMIKDKNFLNLNKDEWYRGKFSIGGWGESLLINDKINSIDFKKNYVNYLNNLKSIVLGYNIFLKNITDAIAVIFLEDCYTPYSRISYRINSKTKKTVSVISQNKKKTIFFGTLFGGLALLYKYQDKKLPQFIIKKSAEFIPFLKKYLPELKQKFISGFLNQKGINKNLVLN